MDFKPIVLVILVMIWLWEMLLHGLNARSARNPIPENVQDVYDAETYAKWRRYHGEKNRLSMVSSTVSMVISVALMGLNAYAAFAGLFPDDLVAQMFAVLLLSAAADLVLIPVNYYDTMVIEEKYGFNRSSRKTFWMDQVKQFILSLLIVFIVGCVLLGLHQWLGDLVIVAFTAAMMLLILMMTFLYPFFSKIFNKFTPLEDGELKEKLTALLEKHGYHVRAIQVMDASRRSTKSNAYFTGFGKMKTIVLYDTIIQQMTTEEICAVFAHEMGHGLHKDTLKNTLLSAGQMLILAVLAWLTLRTEALYTSFGFEFFAEANPAYGNYGFAVILIMSVEFALISPLVQLIANAFSRRHEFRADAQAVEEGYGEELITGLKKLGKENFSNLAPSPLLVKLEYSHPPLDQRIDAIRALEREGKN